MTCHLEMLEPKLVEGPEEIRGITYDRKDTKILQINPVLITVGFVLP